MTRRAKEVNHASLWIEDLERGIANALIEAEFSAPGNRIGINREAATLWTRDRSIDIGHPTDST